MQLVRLAQVTFTEVSELGSNPLKNKIDSSLSLNKPSPVFLFRNEANEIKNGLLTTDRIFQRNEFAFLWCHQKWRSHLGFGCDKKRKKRANFVFGAAATFNRMHQPYFTLFGAGTIRCKLVQTWVLRNASTHSSPLLSLAQSSSCQSLGVLVWQQLDE